MLSAADVPADLTKEQRLQLAQCAYDEFRWECFWSMRRDLVITEANFPMVIEGLKEYGGHRGWKLAQALCP